jgi:hypothetical protein
MYGKTIRSERSKALRDTWTMNINDINSDIHSAVPIPKVIVPLLNRVSFSKVSSSNATMYV